MRVLLLVWLWGGPAVALAQEPYRLIFEAHPDHDQVTASGLPLVTAYEMTTYAPGGVTPVVQIPLGKPTYDASRTITVDVTVPLRDLPASLGCNPAASSLLTCYSATVTATGPAPETSEVSNPFGIGETGACLTTDCHPPILEALTVVRAGQSFNYAVSVSAVDDQRVVLVQVYRNAVLVAAFTAPPYTVTLHQVPVGTHILEARAFDAAGNVAVVSRALVVPER